MKKIFMILMLLLFVCSINYADEIDNLRKILTENIGKEIQLLILRNSGSASVSGSLLTDVTESYIILSSKEGVKTYTLISQIASISFKESKK